MACETISPEQLATHFERVLDERMRGMPIINPRLRVATVGFRKFEGRLLGVLVTPWFMNLVLLPDGEEWAEELQGDAISLDFPSGTIEFRLNKDEDLGSWLSAVLFRSMRDMPDQETACSIAAEIMKDLFVGSSHAETGISRRALFTGLRAR